jgi:hypothetical protein
VANHHYLLERATNLGGSKFVPVVTNITSEAGVITYTDAEAVGDGPFYYRIGVQPSQ